MELEEQHVHTEAEENHPELEQWQGGEWGKPLGGVHQGRTVVF